MIHRICARSYSPRTGNMEKASMLLFVLSGFSLLPRPQQPYGDRIILLRTHSCSSMYFGAAIRTGKRSYSRPLIIYPKYSRARFSYSRLHVCSVTPTLHVTVSTNFLTVFDGKQNKTNHENSTLVTPQHSILMRGEKESSSSFEWFDNSSLNEFIASSLTLLTRANELEVSSHRVLNYTLVQAIAWHHRVMDTHGLTHTRTSTVKCRARGVCLNARLRV